MSFLINLKKSCNSLAERLNWDEYFVSLAILISTRSPSSKLKVGSVIVKDNRVISSGYNGFPSGAPHISIHKDGHEVNTIHSEQNCISDAAKRGVSIENCTIYITHYPCINCCKYIISSGIKKVVYLEDYNNEPIILELFSQANIQIEKMII
jgi:dCMP deaminase